MSFKLADFGYQALIPTFANRCLSAIGGVRQLSRLAGWVQLSAEAVPGPHTENSQMFSDNK